MTSKPTFLNRMCAALAGEVSADTLEAYRRASLAVYDALEHAENHRESAKAEGKNAWTLPAVTQAEILCTWNAFVLQTLGDRLLEADYQNDPQTHGFVPPVTADQILGFYTQVEGWLSRAQQAHYNPDYKLDFAVPALLPPWSEVAPRPDAHLMGLLEAMRAIRDHTEAALAFLNDSPPQNGEQQKSFNQIRQTQAAVATKARYAEDMMGGSASRGVHERVEQHVKDTIEGYYLLGQLLAIPALASRVQQTPISSQNPDSKTDWNTPYYPPSPTPAEAPRAHLPGPGQAGFDMWCLTDPASLNKLKNDVDARHAIRKLWELDPDPHRTLEIQDEINAALARDDIAIAPDRYGKRLGHFFRAPWAPVYVVRRPLTLGGRRLSTMQQFVFNVSCEGVNLGAPFERYIMVGNFNPTARFDYGDPNETPSR